MGAAQQIALRAPDLAEQLAHASHLLRLARVGRARERELFTREAEPLGRPVLDQRQRLERLRRRAPKRHELGVARSRHESASRVHDDDVDVVNGLDPTAAELLDPHRSLPPTPLLSDSAIPKRTSSPPTTVGGRGTS